MVFDLEELENKIDNISKLSYDIDNTYLSNKDSITELYILFILFSLVPLESTQLNDYDVD
tara:strand:- start:4344 stop:4523 length:180 start_codon:yes stop_codon:yes gene_type:complete